MKIYASKLKQLRTRRGWTQQQLAELTDLSLRTIQRIEKTGLISNESLGAICSVFEINNSQLLDQDENIKVEQSGNTRGKPNQYISHFIALVIGGAIGGAIAVFSLGGL